MVLVSDSLQRSEDIPASTLLSKSTLWLRQDPGSTPLRPLNTPPARRNHFTQHERLNRLMLSVLIVL